MPQTAPIPQDVASSGTFARILCAVDGGRPATEAVQQAATLSEPGCELTLLAVSDRRGSGPYAQATLSPRRAEEVVRVARLDALESLGARSADVSVHTEVCAADDPVREILRRSQDYDLLTIGIPPRARSRFGGILLGNVVAHAVHEGPVPVLVARRNAIGAFPGTVVAASSGAVDDAVVMLAVQIAAAAFMPMTIVHVGQLEQADRDALERQVALAGEILGIEPVLRTPAGHVAEQVVHCAEALAAGLIVVGSQKRAGLDALKSVSERVAFHAPCSVLVVRG
jgi:nucleotide-binding universal stress UspA family protein